MARERKQSVLEESLRRCMLEIVTLANTKTDIIPPINFNLDTPVIFPFEVGDAPVAAWRRSCWALW
jgi:hypothetical protein